MSIHPFAQAMSDLRRNVARRLAEHPVAVANRDAQGRDIAAEVIDDIRVAGAPLKPYLVARTDEDREGPHGWDPQPDSGA